VFLAIVCANRSLTNVWRESWARRFMPLAWRRRNSGDPGPVAPPSMTLEVWTYKGLLCDFTFSAIDILLLTFLLPGPIRRCVACLLLGCRSAFLAPSDHAKVHDRHLGRCQGPRRNTDMVVAPRCPGGVPWCCLGVPPVWADDKVTPRVTHRALFTGGDVQATCHTARKPRGHYDTLWWCIHSCALY
jgi:hypothetical protein